MRHKEGLVPAALGASGERAGVEASGFAPLLGELEGILHAEDTALLAHDVRSAGRKKPKALGPVEPRSSSLDRTWRSTSKHVGQQDWLAVGEVLPRGEGKVVFSVLGQTRGEGTDSMMRNTYEKTPRI